MIQSPLDVLMLSGEAALCTEGGLIRFANQPARALLGRDVVGLSVREVFGGELASVQAASFIAAFSLGARPCTARFSRLEKGYLIFLSPETDGSAILNDPLLFSLRSSLMNLGIAADSLRSYAEQHEDAALRRSTAALTGCYYRILRQVENIGFVISLFKGEAALSAYPCDLQRLCIDTVEAIQPFFTRVEFDLVPEGGTRIVADPALFKLLLNNLLVNCLVHADCRHIRVRLSETPQSLLLSVTDDGRGIPPEQLHRAFDRYRYDFDPGQMGRGPGLGLSAARGVAELHGGTLLLESRPGKGTAVRVTFSRSLSPGERLLEGSGGEGFTTRDLLIGLADCLPEEAFTEKYLD